MERSLASRIGSVFIAFVMVFTCCGVPTETISAWADEATGNEAPIEQETAGTQEPEATDPVLPDDTGGDSAAGEDTPPAEEPQQPEADPDLPTEGEDETEADDEEDAGKEEAEDEEEKRDPRDISEDAACISVRPVMFEFTQDGEVFQRDLSVGSADATDLKPETAFDLLLQYTITLKADQCVEGDTFSIGLPEPFLSVDGARMPAGDDVIASYEAQAYGIVATLGEGAESEDEIAYTLFIPVNLNTDALGEDPIDLTIAGYEGATANLTLPAAPKDEEAESDKKDEEKTDKKDAEKDKDEEKDQALSVASEEARADLESGRTTDETTTASLQVKWLDNYDIASREAFANLMVLTATIDGVTKPVSEYLRQLGLSEAPAITASNEGTNVTTYECSGLPVESINGKSVSYSLQEPEAYDGYLKQTNSKGDTYWVKATTCTFNVVYMNGDGTNSGDAPIPQPMVMRMTGKGLEIFDSSDINLDVPESTGTVTLSNVPLYDVEKPETNLAIIYALKAEFIQPGQDGTKYVAVYDNTAVPNFGTKTDACYQGGTTTLRLEGTTSFSATKQWVDECSSTKEKEEKRPKATLYMWRYSEKSNDPKTAYQVYDSNHNAISIDLDVWKDTQALEGFSDLPKYDPEGYKYVYFLREKLFPVEGNDSYEQISGAVGMDEAATPSALSEEEGGAEGEGNGTENGEQSNGSTGVMTNGIVYDGGILSNRVTGTIEITAKKTWVAAALQNKLGDVKVTLELQKKYSDSSSWEWADKTVVLDGFCAELMTRTQKVAVPEFDERGRAIQYRWVETKVEKDGQVIELNPDPETGASTFQLKTTEDDIDSPYQFESSIDENGAVINKLVGTTSYKIIKKWENDKGNPVDAPKGVSLIVDLNCDEQHYASYRIDGDPNTTPGTSVKGETFDDEGWTVTIDNLPKFDDEGHRLTYLAEEKGLDPKDEEKNWSTDYEYRFLKRGDGFDGIVVTNTYGKGPHYYIMVNKQWRDDGDEAHRYPVTIAIFNGGKSTTEPEKTITLDESEAWWEKVEVKDNPNDPANNYYIREVSVGDFPVITANEEDGPFDETSYVETDRNTYVVTYEPPTTVLGIPRYTVTNRRVGTVDITVNKTWVDPDATEAEARPDAMLSLECEEYPEAVTLSTDSAQGSVKIPNLPEDESVTLATQFEVDKVNQESSYTFEKLPKYDINGRVIHYTVTEQLGESPEGSDTYESELVAESYSPRQSTDQDDQTLEFENTVHATTQAVFNKHWNDAYQNSLGNRPDIYLDLWQKTSTDDAPVLTDYKPREWTKDKVNPAYNESCIFPDLPKYDENGEIIEYYASEHTVVDATRFDYTKVSYSSEPIVANNGAMLLPDGGTFTNGCEKNITVTGTKQWENVPKGFIKNDLPIVTIHLEQHQRGTAEDAWTEIASVESDNSLTEWASGGYEYKFTIAQTKDGQPVPYYDENGALYEYQVKETFNKKTEEGFEIAYEADPKINAFSVSNTFVSEKDKKNTLGGIMVDKYWDRSHLEDQSLPYPATTFVLTRAYESDTEGTLVKDDYFSLSKTLSPDDAARGGEHSRVEFTDLLRFAPNGKPYIYTVTEKSIDGYATCVGSGTAEPSTEGNTIVANSDVLKASKDDTVSFKNSYEPGQVNVTGTKLWNDYNNAFGIRPENIKVELHRKAPAASGYGNAIEDEVVLGADGNPLEPTWDNDLTAETWTYTFENLDRYAPNGKAWQYQVVEIAAESDPNGFYGTEDQSTGWKTAGKTGDVVLNEITNKFDMQASVNKQWKGDGPNDDDIYGLRPTSVTVKLQVKEEGGTWQDAADALGTGIESGLSDIVLSSGNRWSHIFRNLPPARKVDGNVVMLSYRVVETKLGDQQFDATVNDDGSYTFAEGSVNLNYKPSSTTNSTKTSSTTTITNTMVDSLVLAATKIWDRDLSNAFGTRPGNGNVWTITLTLQRSTDGINWTNVQKASTTQTVTVAISGDNSKDKETTFEYLPRYDASGNTYQYRVIEEELGAYYKIDTNDPDHYKYSFIQDPGEGNPSFAVELTNEMITTNVSGTKEWKTFQDGVIPDPSAVKLTLYWNTPGGQKSKVPVQPEYTWTKTDTGTWEYKYEENVLPKYNKAGQEYTYTVVESPVDGYNISYKSGNLDVLNTQALGSVTFTKKSTDGKLLAGAKFKLTHPDGTTETLTTDANGKVTLTDLKWGDYTVTEIESPEGYWFDKCDNALGFLPFVSSNNYTKTFTINAQNCKQSINLGSFENKATDIQFAKVDDEGKAVSGAKLKLTGRFAGSNKESSITWTSGNTPKNITAKMVVGETYTLSEAERTYGFRTLPGSVSFVMNDDGTITITQNVQIDGQDLASVDKNGMKLTLTNKRILGGVQLTKTIDGPDSPLARDVRFDLYREGYSTPIKTNLATDSEGIIAVDKLEEGNYYFKETKTIDGAILSTEKVKFSITEQQHAQTVYVSLDNKSTDLSISKVDDDGKALAGAKLTLTGKFADTSQTTLSWTSGDTPEQFTRKLIVGQEYELSEEGRVDGYRTLPGTVKFRIQSDGTIKITQNTNYQGEGALASVSGNGLQLNLTNSKIFAHVQLAKTIDGEGGLEGVTFNLYKEGESAPLQEGLVTNEAGMILVENLPEGSYYFQETATVEGAILDTAKLPFTIEEKDHGKLINVGMDNRSTNVSILKTDNRGNTLADAKLQLTGRFAGNAEATTVNWTSADTAKQFKGSLIVGEPYTLSETGRVAGHVTLPNPITFTVTAEGAISIIANAEYKGTELARVSESGLELTLSNPEIRASAQLTKTLDGTGKLEGATFSVYQKGDNGDTLIEEDLVTDKNGVVKVDNLAEGKYYFVETATIDGAILDESRIDFEITEDLDGTVVEKAADNQTTKISIAKLVRDSAAGEGDPADGDPLPGAKLELTGKFAKTASDTISWTSRNTPKELVGELIVGETYTLTETNRPAGYVQAAGSVQFKVLEDGTIEITKNASFDGKDLASVTNGGLGLNFSNAKIRGSVELTKTIDESEPLEGAVFDLYQKDAEQPLQTGLTTNEDGKIRVDDLAEGEYFFKETATVEGAILNTNTVEFAIGKDDFGKTVEVKADNTSTSIGILKVNSDKNPWNGDLADGATLEGAQLQLTGRFAGETESKTIEWTSGKQAEQFAGKLIVGEEYTLSEKGRVDDYVTLPGTVTFKLDDAGKIQIIDDETGLATVGDDKLTLKLANVKVRGSVELTKTLNDDKQPLKGAVFDLVATSDDGMIGIIIERNLITDANGKIVVDNLPEGKYRFEETRTVNGVIVHEDPIHFEITENDHGKVVAAKAINETTKISFLKVNSDPEPGEGELGDGDPLPGAKMQLTGKFAKTTEDSITWISGEEPEVLDGELIVGETYTLTEIGRVDGYTRWNGSVKIWVRDDGTISIIKNSHLGNVRAELTEDSCGLTLNNVKVRGSVELTKTIDDNEPLEGAQFDLYAKGADKPLQTGLATDADGKIVVDNLPEGSYFFKETATIEGAILNTQPVEFEIAERDHGKVVKASADNESTKISILKVNSDPEPGEGELADKAPLAGAKLLITGRFAGDEELSTYEWTSAEDAEQFSRKLIAGEQYTITEPERVPGYVSLPNPIIFQVTEKGTIEIIQNAKVGNDALASVDKDALNLTLANVKVRGSVELAKTIDGDEPLEGAVFDLYREGVEKPIATGLTTDGEGKIKVSNLAEGEYHFQETATVEGAILNPDPVTFQIAEGHHAKTVYVNPDNKSTDISILKVNRDSAAGEGELADGDPLAGASLKLTGHFANKPGVSSVEWTSAEEANQFLRQLIVGEEYELTELNRVDGYNAITGSVKFVILTDGSISITQNTSFDDKELAAITNNALGLTLANVKVRGSVELAKTIDGDEPLEGAVFDLYKEGVEKPIATGLSTDESGVIEVKDLPEGKYFFKETATIEGAILSKDIVKFGITPENHKGTVEIDADNASTSMGILKVNSDSAPGEGELADGAPLPGAQLTLTGHFAEQKETTTRTWDSTEDAEQFMRGLIVGEKYTLAENGRVDGYVTLPGTVTFELDGDGRIRITEDETGLATVSGDKLMLELANVKVRGSVELTKTIDGDEPLEGAVFDLYEEGQSKPIQTGLATDEDGKIVVKGLAEGEYHFQETATIEGAILNTQPVSFQITEGDHGKIVKASADNESTRISILKVNRDNAAEAEENAPETGNDFEDVDINTGKPADDAASLDADESAEDAPADDEGAIEGDEDDGEDETQLADGDPLPGATLQLTGRFADDEQESTIEWSTSDQNPKEFVRELVVGEEYTLTEVDRVDGYLPIKDPVRFKVQEDGTIKITRNAQLDGEDLATLEDGNLALSLANVKVRSSVQLTKTLAGEDPIEGVTFSLYKDGIEEPLATNLVTNENGMITVGFLPEGSYYFQETATIPGAILNPQPQYFDITEGQHRQTVELTMDNPKTQISIAKVDQSGEPLEGAQLKLSGNFAGTDETEMAWTSGMDPESLTGKLIVGEEYTLSEPTRSSGYAALPNPVVFTLDELGQIQITQNASFAGTELASVSEDGLTLTLANIEIRADVQLTKTLDGETPLPGAVFDLYEEGADNPLKAGLITDNEGRIAVENLPEGSYYFQETEAPSEAVLNSDPIRFAIDESVHGTNVLVDADNKGFSSSISLKKVDSETGKAIPGVQFTLYQVKANGTTVPVGSSLATNNNGYVSFTVNEKGSYRIQETQAAGGYKFDANKAYTASFAIDSDDLHGKTLKLGENSAEEAAAYQLKVSNALHKDGNVANEPEDSGSALKKALGGLAKTSDGLGGLLAGLGALAAAALATLIAAARKRRKAFEGPSPKGPHSGSRADIIASEEPSAEAAENESQLSER